MPVFHFSPISESDYEVTILDDLDVNTLSLISISAERLNPLAPSHTHKESMLEGMDSGKAEMSDETEMNTEGEIEKK